MSVAEKARRDPGALNIRMHVMEPVSNPDGMGGGALSYPIRRSVWAAFTPSNPSVAMREPVADALARGQVRTNISMAPPVGWRLSWTALRQTRTVQVEAVERGTPSDPFDVCYVREVTP